MSKWRDNFESICSTKMVKEAIINKEAEKFRKEIDDALTGTIAGKYKRRCKR